MRYFMINPYKDIPKYAKVKMIGHCYDSGYSCYEVEYRGRTYKPFERDVKSEDSIVESFNASQRWFNECEDIYNKTVLEMNWKSKKTKTGIETYEINFAGKFIHINKNPKIDTDYWCQILYEGLGEHTFWASGEADIKVKLARRKIPKEVIDEFKIIP